MQEVIKQIDISGDVGLEIYGSDIKAVFTNAALGLYRLITPSKVAGIETINLTVTGENKENLMIKWLNELIYIFDVDAFIASKVIIQNIIETELFAVLIGDFFDADRYERGLLIKAATYHNLVFEKQNNGYIVKVIFDI